MHADDTHLFKLNTSSCRKLAYTLCFYTTLFLGLSGCQTTKLPPLPESFPTQEWLYSSPEMQGVNSAKLTEALQTIKQKEMAVDSLMIVRNGYVVLDTYFYPFQKGLAHDVASVTKSVTATLIGIAIQEGFIKSIDQPISDFFPERQAWFEGKPVITIKHLLSMTSGYDCGYKGVEDELFEMRSQENWGDYILQLPQIKTPGSEFSYCSCNTHLLSVILNRATGSNALAFADRYLFSPLGIEGAEWPGDPQDNNLGSGDLRIQPKDMAKIGYLYLNKGKWQDKQIVPTEWVAASSKAINTEAESTLSYGLGWWILPPDYGKMFAARGRGGQEIIIWPDQQTVVVMTAHNADIGEIAPLLTAAIQSNKALPANDKAYHELLQTSVALMDPPQENIKVSPLPAIAKEITNRVYLLSQSRLELNKTSLDFRHAYASKAPYFIANMWRNNQQYQLKVGLDNRYRMNETGPSELPNLMKGHWTSDNQLQFEFQDIGGLNQLNFQLTFKGDDVLINVSDPMGYLNENLKGAVINRTDLSTLFQSASNN